jgi:hypothetical protein
MSTNQDSKAKEVVAALNSVAQRPKAFKPTGAQDGPHHLFRCSRCDAPLADVWVTYPDAADSSGNALTWNMKAECDHCGGTSYERTVTGMFVVGETDESSKYSTVVGYDMSDPIVIQTKKVKNYVS